MPTQILYGIRYNLNSSNIYSMITAQQEISKCFWLRYLFRYEMAGWHHRLDGHEFEWTPGVGDGQGGLACCSPWGCKSRTRLSDWTELNWTSLHIVRIKWGKMWKKIPSVVHAILFGLVFFPPLQAFASGVDGRMVVSFRKSGKQNTSLFCW